MNESVTISKYPFKSVACDASVLIDLLLSGPTKPLFEEIIANNVKLCTTELAITEAQYIVCRAIGVNLAETKIDNLLSSNACDVICISSLRAMASKIKCSRAISIAECFIMALASARGIPALFATRETELDEELKKSPFLSVIYFLDEF